MDENPQSAQAIAAAMDGNWKTAIAINKQILVENPANCEALNRLARAYCEMGKTEAAKKTYQKVLEFDCYNQIASANFKRLTKANHNNNNHKNNKGKFDFQIFLSEPGKTKLVNLVKLATPQTLAVLTAGDELTIVAKKHQVIFTTLDGEYAGALPDDLAHHLINLIAYGNLYQSFVKGIRSNFLQIIIWEKYRAPQLANQPSFLTQKTYIIPSAKKDFALDSQTLEEFTEIDESGGISIT